MQLSKARLQLECSNPDPNRNPDPDPNPDPDQAGLQLECLGVTARGESWLLQLAGRHSLGPLEPLVKRTVIQGESVWVGRLAIPNQILTQILTLTLTLTLTLFLTLIPNPNPNP